MSGGSEKPESPHDRECPHCGLFYRDQGVSFTMHKESCKSKQGSSASQSKPSEADKEPSGGGSLQASNDPGPMGGPSEEDSEPDTSPAPDDPGPCPDCNGELIDFREHDTYTENGRMYDTPDDFYCSKCGKGFNWQ